MIYFNKTQHILTRIKQSGLTVLLLVMTFSYGSAQIGINTDGGTPDASAMVDIVSSEKGMLIPRMSSTARENISDPATGLMVFDLTTNSFWYYTNSWQEITADNLGNHLATQNIRLSDNWLSNDGDNEGLSIDNEGKTTFSGNLITQGNWVTNDGDDEGFFVSPEGLITTSGVLEVDGTLLMNDNVVMDNHWLSGDGDDEGIRVTADGNVQTSGNLEVGSAIIAGGNVELNGNWLSNDGGDEGLRIDDNGTVEATAFIGDGSGLTNAGTDNQTIDLLELDGTTLKISLEGDGASELTVDLSTIVPIGTVQMWPSSTPPTGWFICDGSNFSSSAYPVLATVLGRSQLPDFAGRFPLGVGDSGTNESTNHNLGDVGGVEFYKLTITEIPNHNHGAGTLSTVQPYLSQVGSGTQDKRDGGDQKLYEYSGITGNTASAGGGTPHENMPPYYTINFIIKAQ